MEMRIVATVLILGFLAGTLHGQYVTFDESNKSGTVEFMTIDGFGAGVHGALIEIHGESFANKITVSGSTEETQLEYGVYRVTATLSGFKTIVKEIVVDEPREAVLLAFDLGAITSSGAPNWTKFRVEGLTSRRECGYVKLIPIYLQGSPRVSRLTANTAFAVKDLKAGRYAAIVFGLERLCFVSEVAVRYVSGADEPILLQPK